ncbi:MAG: signal peptidase II [Natronospirillum sp.]|uniref:signal peptidase II n=1 Tax=Natronospirillum sp. TaxID=2812955 RepID=UPI0025E03601|nr:signal peptidase II [Natronospirillum sp.]MCH8550501.1 signal peptidase II [Natronospirillum sp.]
MAAKGSLMQRFGLQPRQARWLLITLAVLVLDQWTKHLVAAHIVFGERITVIPGFFDLIYTVNPGAAFSLLADAGGWQRWFFTVVAVVVSLVLLIWLLRLPRNARWMPVTLTLILGGAIGNVVDRILYGHVADFLLFYWQGYHFPAFNVADIAISIGAVMLLVDAFWLAPRQQHQEQQSKGRS